ncbi:MAG TPA: hypothetical protein VL356_13885 [Acidocella sp.]|jgi:hypothetical protein|nr:hypothetical protein [Acidocella sp.]
MKFAQSPQHPWLKIPEWTLITADGSELEKAEQAARMLFEYMARIDEAKARAVFAQLAERPAHRPPGPTNPGRDVELLRLYDGEQQKAPEKRRGTIMREIAQRLNREKPGEFGNSDDAIRQQIDRLLKARAKRRAEIRRLEEAWGELVSGDTPPHSILGGPAKKEGQ